MTKKYKVVVPEVHNVDWVVTAKNREDAIQKALERDGSQANITYSFTMAVQHKNGEFMKRGFDVEEIES
jgi:hypothetical protein